MCAVYIAQLTLPPAGIIPYKLHESSKLLNLCPCLYNVMQKVVTLSICCVFHMLLALTFRHRASSIQDRRFATLQRTLFMYLINKYI